MEGKRSEVSLSQPPILPQVESLQHPLAIHLGSLQGRLYLYCPVFKPLIVQKAMPTLNLGKELEKAVASGAHTASGVASASSAGPG